MYIQQPLCGEGLGMRPFYLEGSDGCTASIFSALFFKIPLENVISEGLKFKKKIMGGGMPQTPLSDVCAKHTSLYIPSPQSNQHSTSAPLH